MAIYALSASFRICRNRMAIPSSPIDGKPAMHCVTSQPRLLERQLYEGFPDATSTRERVGSKVVVELPDQMVLCTSNQQARLADYLKLQA